jgi:hypothetical protein
VALGFDALATLPVSVVPPVTIPPPRTVDLDGDQPAWIEEYRGVVFVAEPDSATSR